MLVEVGPVSQRSKIAIDAMAIKGPQKMNANSTHSVTSGRVRSSVASSGVVAAGRCRAPQKKQPQPEG